MIKHQRVQMKPVAVRAAFWVRDSFSAGRKKSDTPARTTAHCVEVVYNCQPAGSAVTSTYLFIQMSRNQRLSAYLHDGCPMRKEKEAVLAKGPYTRLQTWNHAAAPLDNQRPTRPSGKDSPEMHRLDTDGAVPQALEEARVGLSLRSGAALPPPAGMLLPLLLTEGGASLGGDLAGSEDGASRRAHKGCCCCRHFFIVCSLFLI